MDGTLQRDRPGPGRESGSGHPPLHLEWWAGTDIGLRRASNQDAFGCFPELGLFLVCDGLGGHAAGEVASRLAVDTIRERIAAEPTAPAADGGERLRAAITCANQRIFEGAGGLPADAERSMATTVVALEVDLARRGAVLAHVGDSRLYRLRAGRLDLLTADHTLDGSRYLGGGEIPTSLPHSNQLLQALGVHATVLVPTGEDALVAGDHFLLCSDGLSGLVEPVALERALATQAPPSEVGPALIRAALDAGGTDNVTVVLVRVTSP